MHDLMLIVGSIGFVFGCFEIIALAVWRVQPLPGYAIDTEASHLVMNGIMAAMGTWLWSRAVQFVASGALGIIVLTLVAASIVRARGRTGTDRGAAIFVGLVHAMLALVMVWLLNMAGDGHPMTMVMPHPVSHRGVAVNAARSLVIAFTALDLLSILLYLATRLGQRSETNERPYHQMILSAVPHLCMAIGMIAMVFE